MTDKEQIIIDGVDVSGCEDFNPTYDVTHNCSSNSERLHSCEGYYCYYKQLQREKQKNEELYECFKQINGRRYAYKQALREIGKIAENNIKEFHFNNLIQTVQVLNDLINGFKQILQKVKEVDNENT
nr:MAG TPA: hypothetical protein [Caudoviricetes sp.]